MRKLLILFFPCSLFAQSHEILRPTMDVNSTSTAIGCSGTNQSSPVMTNAHDAAGLATSSSMFASGSTTVTRYKVRIFTTWATPVQSYTALSLKVNTSGVETINSGSGGTINVAYSLNGGSSWNNIRSGTWVQTTDTVALSTSQDFTKLQVAVCVQSIAGGDSGGDTETLTAWDIWTDGTFSGGASGNGSSQGVPAIQPILISEYIWRRYASYNG